jgi:hypothetical protein
MFRQRNSRNKAGREAAGGVVILLLDFSGEDGHLLPRFPCGKRSESQSKEM